MSREVAGDAPDDAGSVLLREPRPNHPLAGNRRPPPDDSIDPAEDADGPHRAAGHRPAGRRGTGVAVLGLLALAGGAAFGWTGAEAWSSARTRAEAVARDTAASATVVSMSARFDALGDPQAPALVDTLVRVVNLGVTPVTVTGTATAYLAAKTQLVNQVPRSVVPGEATLIRLQVRLACGSALPLGLPPLTLRRSDGTEQPLRIDGSQGELTRICATGPASGQSLVLVSVSRDGDRLTLALDVPSGRTVRLVGVFAGTVALSGGPLPGEIDGQLRTIWLDPPTGCPASWRTQGIPRGLDLSLTGISDEADLSGVHARLHLDIGYALSSWLLDHGCPAHATGVAQ